MATTPQLPTETAIGVDGCPGGWVAAVWKPEESGISMLVVEHLADLVKGFPDATIGIDIPVGLSATDRRQCDFEARRLLGPGRASSFFPAPCRGVLRLNASHAETSAKSKEQTGRGISLQTYHLIPKIAEVDDLVNPAPQERIVEIHPEVSFWALAGETPMEHSKKTFAGFNARRDLLRGVFPRDVIPDNRSEAKALVRKSKGFGKGAGADDVLDAIVAAWSAHRLATGRAQRIADHGERDETRLAMEIVY